MKTQIKQLHNGSLLEAYSNNNGRVEQTLAYLRRLGHTFSNKTMRAQLRLVIKEHGKTLEAQTRGDSSPTLSAHLKDGNYFLTSAQNNTSVHKGFIATVEKFCKINKAKLLISKVTYNKSGFENLTTESKGLWYDPVLLPYLMSSQVQLGDFVFYGNFDILPTAVNPLSGLESHSGTADCAFPHTKLSMRAIATMPTARAKHIYTTGTCTLLNYIDRKAGQKAELHHVYGGLYVEVRGGKATVIPVTANSVDGTFSVYDTRYHKDTVTKAKVYALNFGDIHLEKLDCVYAKRMDRVVQALEPSHIFLHDVLDFEARNHHEDKAKFLRYHKNTTALDDVEANVTELLDWLWNMADENKDITFHVVPSNHNDALYKWANKDTIGEDYVNLAYWHKVNYIILRNLYADCNILSDKVLLEQLALFDGRVLPSNLVFHTREQSVRYKNIEFNLHGDMGINGARGNPQGLAKLGFKANIGHSHSAGIYNGVYVAGVSGTLQHGYNQGLSSWSNAFIITYTNGKRSILTKYPHQGGAHEVSDI